MALEDSVSSLDSSSASSDDGYSSDEELRIAQKEWEENLLQLRLLFTIVLLPYFGKWLGRRWAHSVYARYKQIGLTWALLTGGHSSSS